MRLTGTADEKLERLEQGAASTIWNGSRALRNGSSRCCPKAAGTTSHGRCSPTCSPGNTQVCKPRGRGPIAPDTETLQRRWKEILVSSDQPHAFRETRDRRIDKTYVDFRTGQSLEALANLDADSPCPPVEPYGYRSVRPAVLVADSRLGDFIRPVLWHAHSDRQVYLTSLLTGVLGLGPAATVSAQIPDLHHFRGSFGGKGVIPLWRDADATGRT